VTHKSILFTQPTLPATVLTVFFYTPISVLMDSYLLYGGCMFWAFTFNAHPRSPVIGQIT